MFRTNAVEKIKTHNLYATTFSRKSCRLGDNVEKNGTAGQATVKNMAHARCLLGSWGYKHIVRICNT
jgi:putative IMPACT (imprinted ancient) family translation regulator